MEKGFWSETNAGVGAAIEVFYGNCLNSMFLTNDSHV